MGPPPVIRLEYAASNMRCHGVDLLRFAVKLDGLTTLGFATGAVLYAFVWPLCGVLFGVILQYSALF